MKRLQIIILAVGLLAAATAMQAQVRYRVSAGLSTDWIISDNPAIQRIVPQNDGDSISQDDPFGGSLDGMQVGWGIRCYADLDKQKRFRIPFGLDWHLMSGTQSIIAPTYAAKVTHNVDIWTVHAGFEYAFVEFPLAFARAYVAGEVRGSIIGPNRFTAITRTINEETRDITETVREAEGKPAVFRLGGMVRVGVEGELYYPLFLNTSIGYGAMNLFFRDDRPTPEGRGELLTPTPISEPREQLLQHVNFTFMLQVRL